MSMNFEDRVKCNNCMKEFCENEIVYSEAENKEFCPHCGASGCLMDNSKERGMEELKKKIEDYVSVLLYQYDMAVWRNQNNELRKRRIVERCMSDLERYKHLQEELLQDESKLKYFIRQTILYMV